jgi:RNA polymerase sigma-70 factor (ECF subfamily)
MAAFRMDPRLRGRVNAADIVQEAFVEASAHRDVYFREPTVPLFLWLRGVVSNKLLEMHRRHLGTRMRDAKRERPLGAPIPAERDRLQRDQPPRRGVNRNFT